MCGIYGQLFKDGEIHKDNFIQIPDASAYRVQMQKGYGSVQIIDQLF